MQPKPLSSPSRASCVIALFFCTFLCGCVGATRLPVRARGPAGSIQKKEIDLNFVQVGTTRREEVINQLGAISTGYSNSRLFWGRWTESKWGYWWVVGYPCNNCMAGDAHRKWHIQNLLVAFDEKDSSSANKKSEIAKFFGRHCTPASWKASPLLWISRSRSAFHSATMSPPRFCLVKTALNLSAAWTGESRRFRCGSPTWFDLAIVRRPSASPATSWRSPKRPPSARKSKSAPRQTRSEAYFNISSKRDLQPCSGNEPSADSSIIDSGNSRGKGTSPKFRERAR